MLPDKLLDADSHDHTHTVAVVLCAGQGSRMGASQNKVFLPLGGIPLLVRTLRAFEAAPSIDEVLLVAHPDETDYAAREILGRYPLAKVAGVIPGGATRHQSEQRALDSLRERIETGAIGIVLIHDGARPFVTPDDIERVVAAARATEAAILVVPLAEHELLFALRDDGMLEPAPALEQPGEQWLRAQTPQGGDARTLLAAYDRARAQGFEGTDTAATLERLGIPIMAVTTRSPNLKVTTPDDLLRAEALLSENGA